MAKGVLLLAEMAARLSHTGHERAETWIDPGRRFAVGRVSLPWLPDDPRWAPGSRPAPDPLVFVEGSLRGDAARQADLLRDLARHGLPALLSLRGSFVVARWEPAARRLSLAVDRRASRPLCPSPKTGGYKSPFIR